MKLKSFRMIAVVTIMALVGAVLQPSSGDATARSNREVRLQGTWRVQITPTNCQGGSGAPPFSTLLSFHRGGTLTEVIGSPAFLPGQRSTGVGVWSHTRGNAYKGVWEGLMLFDSPAPGVFKRGVQRLQFDFEVYGDQLTTTSTGQFIDINGNVYASTCASGTGTRFEDDAEDED